MNPLPEQLNDRLESQMLASRGDPAWPATPHWSVPAADEEPEVETLVSLAQRLRSAQPLRVDPGFALLLQRRILAQNALMHQKPSRRSRPGSFWAPLLRLSPSAAVACCCIVLVVLSGLGVLVAAAQVSNPTSPLYVVKHWEQGLRLSVAASSVDRAELDCQYARERLMTLGGLATPSQEAAYQEALLDLDQQISAAARAISALPTGPDRVRLSGDLATLQVDARRTLRGLLPRLALPERLLTTTELGRLGDTVSSAAHAAFVLKVHPQGQATISITGEHLQPGAQLLVDTQVVVATGSLQGDTYVFVINWSGTHFPENLGILNADGTAALTTNITLVLQENGGHGTGGTPGHGNNPDAGGGHGNGGGKPSATPSPSH